MNEDTRSDAEKARETIRIYSRVYSGRDKIARAEDTLKVSYFDIWNDDDLIVIFAEEMRKN